MFFFRRRFLFRCPCGLKLGRQSLVCPSEFSASHAQRIIGPGVVLERKASISTVAVELKNKVGWESVDWCPMVLAGR